jgi:metal-responsive CopG/Arc/MetJ family transcriptional regulator
MILLMSKKSSFSFSLDEELMQELNDYIRARAVKTGASSYSAVFRELIKEAIKDKQENSNG